MKVQFVRARGFDDVTLTDLPSGWPVPRVGEAVQFVPAPNHPTEPTWLVVDVLWTYAPNIQAPIIVIKLHPEG